MRLNKNKHLLAVLSSLAVHALVISLVSNTRFVFTDRPDRPKAKEVIIFLAPLPPAQVKRVSESADQELPANSPPVAAPLIQNLSAQSALPPRVTRPLVSQAAPPAPTAQDWAFAAKYTLKNSKGYRHIWGQQVRSMMGTAVEGPDQGMARFRVEIAPDGTLAKLDTLWTTSAVAERLARKAIENMPPSPPTPTGRPLIFEKTISFSPFESDGTPSYQDDCLPDPPAFRNPFAWDGKSPQVRVEPEPVETLDPKAMEGCLRQLPQNTIEAESARDQRLIDQWGSNKTGQ